MWCCAFHDDAASDRRSATLAPSLVKFAEDVEPPLPRSLSACCIACTLASRVAGERVSTLRACALPSPLSPPLASALLPSVLPSFLGWGSVDESSLRRPAFLSAGLLDHMLAGRSALDAFVWHTTPLQCSGRERETKKYEIKVSAGPSRAEPSRRRVIDHSFPLLFCGVLYVDCVLRFLILMPI